MVRMECVLVFESFVMSPDPSLLIIRSGIGLRRRWCLWIAIAVDVTARHVWHRIDFDAVNHFCDSLGLSTVAIELLWRRTTVECLLCHRNRMVSVVVIGFDEWHPLKCTRIGNRVVVVLNGLALVFSCVCIIWVWVTVLSEWLSITEAIGFRSIDRTVYRFSVMTSDRTRVRVTSVRPIIWCVICWDVWLCFRWVLVPIWSLIRWLNVSHSLGPNRH